MGIRKGNKGANVFIAGGLAETYDGDGGFDLVSYSSAGAVTIDLVDASANRGHALGDDFISIESFRLSRSSDRFFGNERTNYVNGDRGNDRIDGRGGNDALSGHAGDDTLIGGDGNDGLWGGSGSDLILSGTGNDLVHGDAGHDDLRGDAGNDTINGGSGNDSISGGADNGSFTIATDSTSLLFELSPGIRVEFDGIDEKGEFVTTHKWAQHNRVLPSLKSNAVTEVATLPDGDRLVIITNKSNLDLKFDIGTSLTQTAPGPLGTILQQTKESFLFGSASLVLEGNKSIIVNIGPAEDTGLTVDSGWTLTSFQPVVKFAEQAQTATIVNVTATSNATQMVPERSISSFTAGDQLTGGSGSDIFRFAMGDGVDRITDFQKGFDRIDVDNTWFDGNIANGEYKAFDHAGGAVIVFADNSRDGFVDGAAIMLAGLKAAAIDSSVFI